MIFIPNIDRLYFMGERKMSNLAQTTLEAIADAQDQMPDISVIRPSELHDMIVLCATLGRNLFIWGAPGIGKSAITAQAAETLGKELRDVRAVQLDAVDIKGLPYLTDGATPDDNKNTVWSIPDFLPKEGEGLENGGMLFWDELNAASSMTKAALLQLILDRKLGDYEMPDNWVHIAAGNRETDGAFAQKLGSAQANRFVHVQLIADTTDWLEWAYDSGQICDQVIGFMRHRPALIHVFDQNHKAFPTPRSWEFVSDAIRSILGDDNPDATPVEDMSEYAHVLEPYISGAVGRGAANEVMGYLEIYKDLPNPDFVLSNPTTAPTPANDNPAANYALVGLLARRATGDNAANYLEYVARLGVEFEVLAVTDAVRLDTENDFQQTRAVINWTAEHQDVLM